MRMDRRTLAVREGSVRRAHARNGRLPLAPGSARLHSYLRLFVAIDTDQTDNHTMTGRTNITTEVISVSAPFSHTRLESICNNARARALQIKEAFPSLPLVFHTHYQSGYGYMAYLVRFPFSHIRMLSV